MLELGILKKSKSGTVCVRKQALSVGLFCAILVGYSGLLCAQQNSLNLNSPKSVSVYRAKKTPPKANSEDLQTSIDLDAKAISYAEASAVDNQLQQQIQVGLRLKKSGRFFTDSHIIVGTFSEPQSVYYAFPEAYVGYGSREANVTFGRKLENLSFADDFNNFGMMQGYFTNDGVDFITGGLTGLSGHYNGDGYGFMLSYDPIFIPNQEPQSRFDDGKIVSSNRWSPAPPSKFKFGDEYKDINYALRDYELTDIIAHSGYVAHAYAGGTESRPWISMTYAYKPINEIALSRDTYSDINTFEGYVLLTPVVLYHQVYSADLNMDNGNFKSTLSFIGDEPQNLQAQDQEYIQTLNPLRIASFYASLDFSTFMHKPFLVYASVAEISGGEIKDINSEGKESSFAIATSRTKFKRPLKVGMKSEMFYIYNQPVSADVALTYDQELKGSLLSIKAQYAASKKFKVSLGADLIGVENDLPSDSQGNFLDQNKANDRFSAGVNYVF